MFLKFFVSFVFFLSCFSFNTFGQRVMKQSQTSSNAQFTAGTTVDGGNQFKCDDSNVISVINGILDLVSSGSQISSTQGNTVLTWMRQCCPANTSTSSVGKLCTRILEIRGTSSTIKVQGQVSSGDQTTNSSSGLTNSQLQTLQEVSKAGVLNGVGTSSGTGSNNSGNDMQSFENLGSVSGQSNDPCFQSGYFLKNVQECCAPGKNPMNTQGCLGVCSNEPYFSQHRSMCCNQDYQFYNQKWCTIPDQVNQCSDITYLSDPANYKICCNSSNESRDVNACGEVLCRQQTADSLVQNETLKKYCCNEKASFFQYTQKICLVADSTNSCQNIQLQDLQKDPNLYKQCCTGSVDAATKKICDAFNVTEEVNYCEDTSHNDEVDNAEKYFSACCSNKSNQSNKDIVKRCSIAQCLDPSFIKKSFDTPKNTEIYSKMCCSEKSQNRQQIMLCQKASQLPDSNEEVITKEPEVKNPVVDSVPEVVTPVFEVDSSFNNNNNFDLKMCLDPNLIRKFEKDESSRSLINFHKRCCANRMAFKKKFGKDGRKLELQCVKVKKMIAQKNETFQEEVLESKCSNDKNFNANDPREYMKKCCSKEAKNALGSNGGEFCQKGNEILEREGITAKCEKGGLNFILENSQNLSKCCNNSIMISKCKEASQIKQCMKPKVNRERFNLCCKNVSYDPLREMCQKTKHRLKREKELRSEESSSLKDRCLVPQVAFENYGKCCKNINDKDSPERAALCKEVGIKLKSQEKNTSSNDKCLVPQVAFENYGKCCANGNDKVSPERAALCKEVGVKLKSQAKKNSSKDKCLVPKVVFDNYGKCCKNGNDKASPERAALCKKVGVKLKASKR